MTRTERVMHAIGNGLVIVMFILVVCGSFYMAYRLGNYIFGGTL